MPNSVRIEKRCKQQTGIEFSQYMLNAKGGRVSLNTVAKVLGCKRETLVRAIKRCGIDWPTNENGNNMSYYGLTINGILDTKSGHCRRAGVTYDMVEFQMTSLGLSFPEALAVTVGKKQVRSNKK